MDFKFSNGTITNYTGTDSEVIIPGTIDGQQVTTIGEAAFFRCKGLAAVNIPSTVTTIGKGAFYECERLSSVNISSSVTRIEEYAFYGCDISDSKSLEAIQRLNPDAL